MEKDNTYKNGKIYSGYYIKCNGKGVVNVQRFNEGIFKYYVELKEVDSVLNGQIKKLNRKIRATCDPMFGKDITESDILNEDGFYKNGQFNGKKYIFDKNGLLTKIEIWKKGKYCGDAQIE